MDLSRENKPLCQFRWQSGIMVGSKFLNECTKYGGFLGYFHGLSDAIKYEKS